MRLSDVWHSDKRALVYHAQDLDLIPRDYHPSRAEPGPSSKPAKPPSTPAKKPVALPKATVSAQRRGVFESNTPGCDLALRDLTNRSVNSTSRRPTHDCINDQLIPSPAKQQTSCFRVQLSAGDVNGSGGRALKIYPGRWATGGPRCKGLSPEVKEEWHKMIVFTPEDQEKDTFGLYPFLDDTSIGPVIRLLDVDTQSVLRWRSCHREGKFHGTKNEFQIPLACVRRDYPNLMTFINKNRLIEKAKNGE